MICTHCLKDESVHNASVTYPEGFSTRRLCGGVLEGTNALAAFCTEEVPCPMCKREPEFYNFRKAVKE